jgi:hypothetical protein
MKLVGGCLHGYMDLMPVGETAECNEQRGSARAGHISRLGNLGKHEACLLVVLRE